MRTTNRKRWGRRIGEDDQAQDWTVVMNPRHSRNRSNGDHALRSSASWWTDMDRSSRSNGCQGFGGKHVSIQWWSWSWSSRLLEGWRSVQVEIRECELRTVRIRSSEIEGPRSGKGESMNREMRKANTSIQRNWMYEVYPWSNGGDWLGVNGWSNEWSRSTLKEH